MKNRRHAFQAVVCLLFIALTCGSCDFIYGLLQRSGAEEKAFFGELLPYTPNDKVMEVQQLLSVYGYNPGKPDGLMGQKTRDALEEFQKANNLKPTRFVDKRTWRKLSIVKDVNLMKDGEINIETLQMILKDAGFDPGKIDGKKGRKTIEALKAFQESNGLKPDGIIGPMTLKTLIDFVPVR